MTRADRKRCDSSCYKSNRRRPTVRAFGPVRINYYLFICEGKMFEKSKRTAIITIIIIIICCLAARSVVIISNFSEHDVALNAFSRRNTCAARFTPADRVAVYRRRRFRHHDYNSKRLVKYTTLTIYFINSITRYVSASDVHASKIIFVQIVHRNVWIAC